MTVLPLFTSKNRELLTRKARPASPIYLSGWQRKKRTCMLVKEDIGWEDGEI
uniref:Uncharacterized protein n=1 Tax=Marmota marmota marmota TaxID=9994 RepID=A0A8C6ETH5_MARMA